MKDTFYLEEALERSPERSAFRVGAQGDIWEARIETGETPYTLIHTYRVPSYPHDRYEREVLPPYATLDHLLGDQARLDAWLQNNDWFPVNEETKKRFSLPGS
ncbi:MAG TPA: hypothetical protein VF043_12965 [Ktedonobacteraceae bacterium]